MQTERIELNRDKARELWRDYRKHVHYSQPIDREVMTTYRAIACGRVVIRALESIRTAGLDEQGLPKLAIVRADAERCWFQGHTNGSAFFGSSREAIWRRSMTRQRIAFAPGSFAGLNYAERSALVPIVPLPLRPKRGLANYHILFEAVWHAAPPVDPMLLRRIGAADLWIVCAAWDLTPVEQAVLAARITA